MKYRIYVKIGTLNILDRKYLICFSKNAGFWHHKLREDDYLITMKPYKQKVIIGEINYNGPIDEEKIVVQLHKLLRYKHDI